MTLTITEFTENAGSRRGDSTSSSRSYTVAGVDSVTADPMTETQLSTWLISQIGTNIPASVVGLTISQASYTEFDQIPGQYTVTITWDVETDVGYRFNFQAQGGHFVQSLSTISAWGLGGTSVTAQPLDLAGHKFPNFGGAINVVPQEDGSPKVEGADVSPPPEIFSFSYKAYDASVTTDYQKLLYTLCGKVNSTAFKIPNSVDHRVLDAGSTMLVRASGERRLSPIGGHLWTLEFGFGYIPNLAAPLYIGDGLVASTQITVLAKDGMDLMWIWRGKGKDTSSSMIRDLPQVAYIERVWERADLNLINLPGVL